MTEHENGVAEETARAMRQLAGAVTDAPPLRLTGRRDVRAPRDSHASWPARWTLWGVPLAAAIAVIALAVVLVLVRDLPDGGRPRPAGPTYPAAVAAPAYYVTPEADCSVVCGAARLVVGETFTGATLATVFPPHGSTFMAVSGAADDRTFVTDAVAWTATATGPRQATWYRLTLAPGSAAPARLTRLPIPAGPAGAGVQAIALSASGRKLAVTYHLGSVAPGSATPGTIVLRIYSMTTGRLLRSWSTTWLNLFGSDWYRPGLQFNNQLSWVDGDHAIAFASAPPLDTRVGNPAGRDPTVLRVLNVAAGGADLIADSSVVWAPSGMGAGHAHVVCGLQHPPSLTANGRTVLCQSAGVGSTGSGAARRATVTMTWQGLPTSDPNAARILYRVRATTVGQPTGSAYLGLLWASASGSTLIVSWAVDNVDNGAAHVGIVRDGRFTPLPLPRPGPGHSIVGSPGIAW